MSGFGAAGEVAVGEQRPDHQTAVELTRWEKLVDGQFPGQGELVIAVEITARKKDV